MNHSFAPKRGDRPKLVRVQGDSRADRRQHVADCASDFAVLVAGLGRRDCFTYRAQPTKAWFVSGYVRVIELADAPLSLYALRRWIAQGWVGQVYDRELGGYRSTITAAGYDAAESMEESAGRAKAA